MIIPDVSRTHAKAILGKGRDGELSLHLNQIYTATNSPWAVPAYRFDVVVGAAKAGTISLRVSNDNRLKRFAGHVGFGIDDAFRGRRLAGRSVKLLIPLAASHLLKPLWIGCNPDNSASMKVMAWLGATYIETVDLPADYERYYLRGERQKRRYCLDYV
jgi:predicted acetyltransferase